MLKEEINKKEIQKTIDKINQDKSWFFEKVNKMDKPLARLTKERKKKKKKKKKTKKEKKKEKSQKTKQKNKKKKV